MDKLPVEIIDKIILYTNFEIAIIIGSNYCINKFYDKKTHTIKWAAKNGEFEIFKFLYNHGEKLRRHITHLPIKYGYLDIIEFLYETQYEFPKYSIVTAIKYNQFEVIKYLYNKIKHESGLMTYMEISAVYSHLYIFKWLFKKNNYKFDNYFYMLNLTKHNSDMSLFNFVKSYAKDYAKNYE